MALACCLAPASAQATPVTDAFDVLQSPDAVRAYWTPERMENAIPLLPALDGEGGANRGTIAERVRRVKRGAKKTHGKVFMTFSGVDYVCSGTSVNAPSDSLVWTAGHCVYEPGALGGKATNFEFVPAYKNGEAPFGEWPAEQLNATSQWKNGGLICLPGISFGGCGDVSYDLGAASVASSPQGRKLHERVGARGIDFNGPRDRTYKIYGYPAEGEFDGEHLYRCKSPYQGADNSAGNPKPMRATCDMTGGSSGGGWIAGGKVASVVSYGYSDEPNKLYGPYQGNAARALYDSIDNG